MSKLLVAVVATIGLSGCMTQGGERTAEGAATLINGYCDRSIHWRAIMKENVGPYLKPGNGVHCAGDMVARQ